MVNKAKNIGRLLLRAMSKWAVAPILSGPVRGLKWIVGAGQHGCWLGIYEKRKALRFAQAILTGFTVYDIGAHAGYYTLIASKKGAGKMQRVFAFEPWPPNYRYLQCHIALNNLSNVTAVQVAVSNTNGMMAFEKGGSSYIGHLGHGGGASSQGGLSGYMARGVGCSHA